MNANQLTKIPVEKLSDTLQFLIVENEIPLSDALKQVIDDVDAVCKKLLRDESAPAKPVIPEQPEPTISFYRDGIIAAAKWVENQRDAYDNEHGQSDPDTGAFEFGNDAQLEYSTTLSEIAEGIRSLHPYSAPYVSFDELMAAVNEVTGVKYEFDATPSKCHQIVPFMNFNSLSRIVEMFRTAQPVSEPYKWISVKDDTPTESGDYWCYLGKDFESPTKYHVVHFDVRHHEFQDHRVTHWMRLPAEPEQEA